MRIRFLMLSVFGAASLLLSVPTEAQTPKYNPRTVLRKPMPAIVEPQIVSADKADLSANALVLGVVIDGEARAYPINQLTGPRREIINDTLHGIAIAATW